MVGDRPVGRGVGVRSPSAVSPEHVDTGLLLLSARDAHVRVGAHKPLAEDCVRQHHHRLLGGEVEICVTLPGVVGHLLVVLPLVLDEVEGKLTQSVLYSGVGDSVSLGRQGGSHFIERRLGQSSSGERRPLLLGGLSLCAAAHSSAGHRDYHQAHKDDDTVETSGAGLH